MAFNDDYDWYCDDCDAYLNDQSGFSTIGGTWRCTECGALNDVSAGNTRDLLGMLKNGITEFLTRPLDESDDED